MTGIASASDLNQLLYYPLNINSLSSVRKLQQSIRPHIYSKLYFSFYSKQPKILNCLQKRKKYVMGSRLGRLGLLGWLGSMANQVH
uniref:Uncharacterized protein n=1 Tax=Arundo donax TaxID=35708 RepID=A0A0A9GZD0_ARUDO